MKLEAKLGGLLTNSSPYTDILVRTDAMVAVREPHGWSTMSMHVDADTVSEFACEVLGITRGTTYDSDREGFSKALYKRLLEQGAQNESTNVFVSDPENGGIQESVRLRVDISLATRANEINLEATAFDVGMNVDELVVELVIRRHRPITPMSRLFQGQVCKLMQEELMKETGLILVTGQMGSGKTSTCASMIDFLNDSVQCHILTIEDPVEYRHMTKEAVFSMKEVGKGPGMTFVNLARNALRQNPDVVFISELRDAETTRNALLLAQSTLVITTTHAPTLDQAIERIVNFFPGEAEEKQTYRTLKSVLLMILSQALLPAKAGGYQMFYELVLSYNRAMEQSFKEGSMELLRKHLDDTGTHKTHEFLKTANYAGPSADDAKMQAGIIAMNPQLAMGVVRGIVEENYAARASPNKANFEKLGMDIRRATERMRAERERVEAARRVQPA